MSSETAKATLYTFDGSVWAAAPRLVLIEKGYSDQDVDLRQVNLLKAENFSPSYLRINRKGIVPTLVVPILETTSKEVDTKFQALIDTKSILEFLDQSRTQSILDQKGINSVLPAPILSPATVQGKTISDYLIKLVHDEKADPNFLLLGAKNSSELEANQSGIPGIFVRNRYEALLKYQSQVSTFSTSTADGSANPKSSATVEQLTLWYQNQFQLQNFIFQVYLHHQDQDSFFESSKNHWKSIADTLSLLESNFQSPFALGDQLSLADFHVFPWLVRLVSFCSKLPQQQQQLPKDKGDGEEILWINRFLFSKTLENHESAKKGVGSKLIVFWKTMKQRKSFQVVYGSGLY